ncbi:MAG: prepilin-type N-terminal cleavage/methylation domain-containing protein [Planctomycetes bacterium]|nr:prepilin-type N-terminal cleavage/methylation domain-containing protein [Planctomycetota bacterium]
MRGFTLVELLVSLALGLIIALTAWAGFRVAAKTLGVAQNLSRENRVLVEGYGQAMTECDFWYAEDDPFDAAGQPQRQRIDDAGNPAIASPGTTGWPFFFDVSEETTFGQPFAPVDLSDEFWNLNVSDPRTWSRQGCYKAPNFNGWLTGSYAQVGCIGHPDPEGEWMHVEQDRMYSNLGWNGYLDYLPNPWIIGYYLGREGPGAPTTDSEGSPVRGSGDFAEMYTFPRPLWLISMNGFEIYPSSGLSPETALGRMGVHLYGITTCFAPRTGWVADGAAPAYVRVSQRSIVNRWSEWAPLEPRLHASLPHLSLTQDGWPQAKVKVIRRSGVHGFGRVEALVGVANPTTGAVREFSFTPIDTSLRGARQQRQWAHWGAASMDR